LQGLRGPLLFPQLLLVIQVTFPVHERPRRIIRHRDRHGVVLQEFTGRAAGERECVQAELAPIFLINLPIVQITILAAMRSVREARSLKARRLDLGVT
jgi:hypothetical protein